MKQILIFCIFILIGMLLLGVLPTHGEAEIYDSVVRLHVLANSDSEYDQALKLQVRDGVLASTAELLSDCTTREQALEIVGANLETIRRSALEVIEREGAEYDVTVKLCEEDYPTKNYESVCFPAGRYMSLQVCIGDAEGKNWWCVLFPGMCLSAASKTDAEQAFIQAGLTPEQYKLVTESDGAKYKLRFKFLEILQQTFGTK